MTTLTVLADSTISRPPPFVLTSFRSTSVVFAIGESGDLITMCTFVSDASSYMKSTLSSGDPQRSTRCMLGMSTPIVFVIDVLVYEYELNTETSSEYRSSCNRHTDAESIACTVMPVLENENSTTLAKSAVASIICLNCRADTNVTDRQ